jgi:hypothetical protein
MSRKYDTFDISPALRAAIDALCEHVPAISDNSDHRVVLSCLKCGALGEQIILPKPGDVVWGEDVPSVTLVRVKVFEGHTDETPLEGCDGDSAGVFYQSRGFRDIAEGALRGLSYTEIEKATEKEPDVRDLRKNLTAWLDAVENLDLTAGFDATLEVLCALPRWEELCYFKQNDSYRSAIDLDEVGYGERDLTYYLSYFRVAEFSDDYTSIHHPVISWLDYLDEATVANQPNWRSMEAPTRQVLELCIASASDCARRVKRKLKDGVELDKYLETLRKEVLDLVDVLRETMTEGDDIASTQDLLDGYTVEERSNQDTSFYVVLRDSDFPHPKSIADEYQAWSRGEVEDYRVETCKVYRPSELEDIKGDARVGDWELVEDDDDLYGTWYGDGLRKHIEPLVEKYAEDNGAHYVGATLPY